MQNEEMLFHYGIKGQKWGVRRYQNYDGSYTKRGLERYNKSVEKYERAKTKQSEAKAAYKSGEVHKSTYQNAKANTKAAKREVDKNYKQLKYDKLADEGKNLYKRGVRITANERVNTFVREVGIVVGSNVVSGVLASMGKYDLAVLSAKVIGVGGTAVNAALGIKAYRQNKRLRAYYAH